MRIGHYRTEIWHQGGVSSYVQRVAEGQRARGHEVFFFDRLPTAPLTPDRPGTAPVVVNSTEALFQKAADLQLDVLNVHETLWKVPEDRVPTVRTLHGHSPYCPSGSQHLKRTGGPCGRVYDLGGCLRGHFVDRCGSIRPGNLQRAFRQTERERQVLPQITTITVSHFLKQRMVRAGYPAGRIRVLHSPAPEVEEPFRPPPEAPVRFVFVGRIVPQKGLSVLLRAMAQVSRDVHLDVAGAGDSLDDAKALVHELGIADRVIFHGWCAAAEVERLIQDARALVFPSTWHEPAGLVSLEAAACGRPVIASDVGGIAEYALEEYALHVPPNDAGRLAEAITALAQDRNRAERMGRAGQHAARARFPMQQFMQQLDEIYVEVVKQKADYAAT